MGINEIDDFGKLLEIKRYSNNTVAVYVSFVKLFYFANNERDLSLLKNNEIVDVAFNIVDKKSMLLPPTNNLLVP